MNNQSITALITGKHSDFKKEEYNIMLTRIEAINNALTEKCKLICLLPLGAHFSFNFKFHGIDAFLKKIDDFDKKQRKDPLKKWWMNQKASEMATNYLPAVLDRLDQVSADIAKQEKSELLQHKFQKYITFELLECALDTKFSRPRAASSAVFPNTSFQYARSRLRKKLENLYFAEAELTNMSATQKKKKEEWVKMIKTKKFVCKQKYSEEKTKKLKLKKQHQRMKKQLRKQESSNKMPYLTTMSSVSTTVSSTVCSSDRPILPPPPPPMPPTHCSLSSSVRNHNIGNINVINMANMAFPHTNAGKQSNVTNGNNSGFYCENCTALNIELSKLTKDLHSFKITLGNAQSQAQHWQRKYESLKGNKSAKNIINIDYKQKYEQTRLELQDIKSKLHEIKSSYGSVSRSRRSDRSVRRRNNSNVTMAMDNGHRPSHSMDDSLPNIPNIVSMMNGTGSRSRTRGPSQASMSWKSSEFSVNAISDKMSISGGQSVENFNFMNNGMNSIIGTHLKHDSNSTEKMLEQLQYERREDGISTIGTMHNFSANNIHNLSMPFQSHSNRAMNSNDQILCKTAEELLYPIMDSNANNNTKSSENNTQSQSVNSQTTIQSNTHSSFAGMNQNVTIMDNVSGMPVHVRHHRSREHINHFNKQTMFVDSHNNIMPKIQSDNNGANNNIGNGQFWNVNRNNNGGLVQNNLNFNRNNMNSNTQFPPPINGYENNQQLQ